MILKLYLISPCLSARYTKCSTVGRTPDFTFFQPWPLFTCFSSYGHIPTYPTSFSRCNLLHQNIACQGFGRRRRRRRVDIVHHAWAVWHASQPLDNVIFHNLGLRCCWGSTQIKEDCANVMIKIRSLGVRWRRIFCWRQKFCFVQMIWNSQLILNCQRNYD